MCLLQPFHTLLQRVVPNLLAGAAATNALANVEPFPLFDLPQEIFLLIIDQLDLCDLFPVSQTCRSLRYLVGRNWVRDEKILFPNHDARIVFFEGIAAYRPDFYACARCAKLHSIYPRETPVKLQSRCRSGISPQHSLYFSKKWRLRHCHVQMALKFSRMGIQKDYLEALTKTFESWSYITAEETMARFYKAGSKVVRGRFAVGEEWIYVKFVEGETITRADLNKTPLGICPHQILTPNQQASPDFENVVEHALANPNNMYKGRCDCCWTEYVVILHTINEMRFCAYRDLGDTGSGLDPHLTLQLMAPDNNPWCRRPIKLTEESPMELYLDGGRIGS